MLHIPKIFYYLKILTDDKVIKFGEYFKSRKEKFRSKLIEEQNLKEFVELLYIFLTTPDKIEKFVEMV